MGGKSQNNGPEQGKSEEIEQNMRFSRTETGVPQIVIGKPSFCKHELVRK
jgi:hypothetical protein